MQRHSTSDTRQPASNTRHPSLVTLYSALCLAVLSASAKTVYVTPTGAGDKDGTSWGNAFATLADAQANPEDNWSIVCGSWYATNPERSDGHIHFPIKIRSITVDMNRRKLDLIDFKPTVPVIRLGPIVAK